MVLNNENLSFYSSRGYMSKIKVSIVPWSLQGENILHAFLLASDVVDIPWLIDISLQSLPLSSHGILPMCLYLCLCLFSYKETSPIGSKANPNDSILTCLHLPRCYFQIRSHSNKVLEIKTATYLFRDTTHDRI